MTLARQFPRHITALDEIVAFTEAALAATALGASDRQRVHFVVEELFTNLVKYGVAGGRDITIAIDAFAAGAQVTLVEPDALPFDPTRAPDADPNLSLAQREPGGLGIHLSRRLADGLNYTYDEARREGRTRICVGQVPAAPAAAPAGDEDGDDHDR